MPFRVVNGKDCTMVRSEGIKDVKKKTECGGRDKVGEWGRVVSKDRHRKEE